MCDLVSRLTSTLFCESVGVKAVHVQLRSHQHIGRQTSALEYGEARAGDVPHVDAHGCRVSVGGCFACYALRLTLQHTNKGARALHYYGIRSSRVTKAGMHLAFVAHTTPVP